MRIAQVTISAHAGGGTRHMQQLCRYLGPCGRGHDVHCFLFKAGPMTGRLKSDGANVHFINGHPLSHEAYRHLVSFLVKYKIDLLHCHGRGASICARLASKRVKIPVVYTLHGFHTRAHGIFSRRAYIMAERYLARFTSAIISVSSDEYAEIKNTRIIAPERLHLVRNGIDFAHFSRQVEPVKINGIDASLPVVGCMCRLEHTAKQPELLVRACAFAKSMGRPFNLVFLGDGPDLHILKHKADSAGINAVFLPPVEDVRPFLAAIDLFALATRWEGMPLGILEAMAAGVPVIASDVRGVRELLARGDYGYPVWENDPVSWANAVNTVIDEKDAAIKTTSRARRHVAESYRLDKQLSKTEEIYSKILAG